MSFGIITLFFCIFVFKYLNSFFKCFFFEIFKLKSKTQSFLFENYKIPTKNFNFLSNDHHRFLLLNKCNLIKNYLAIKIKEEKINNFDISFLFYHFFFLIFNFNFKYNNQVLPCNILSFLSTLNKKIQI